MSIQQFMVTRMGGGNDFGSMCKAMSLVVAVRVNVAIRRCSCDDKQRRTETMINSRSHRIVIAIP
jgi:hypothetical protein